jgi:hypothetical protein
VTRPAGQAQREVGADEPGAARDEHSGQGGGSLTWPRSRLAAAASAASMIRGGPGSARRVERRPVRTEAHVRSRCRTVAGS